MIGRGVCQGRNYGLVKTGLASLVCSPAKAKTDAGQRMAGVRTVCHAAKIPRSEDKNAPSSHRHGFCGLMLAISYKLGFSSFALTFQDGWAEAMSQRAVHEYHLWKRDAPARDKAAPTPNLQQRKGHKKKLFPHVGCQQTLSPDSELVGDVLAAKLNECQRRT
jgi:hypothetical protein